MWQSLFFLMMRTVNRLSVWMLAWALTLGTVMHAVEIHANTQTVAATAISKVLMPGQYDRSGGDQVAALSSCSAVTHCNAISRETTTAIETPRANISSLPLLPIPAGLSASPDPLPPKSSLPS
jgi:hypothetical protein